MRTNVYTLGLLGALGALACSPADDNNNTPYQPVQSTAPQPGPVAPGTVNPNPTGVQPLPTGVNPDPGVTSQPGVNPQPTGVNPQPITPVGPGPVDPGPVDPGPTEECKTGDNLAVIHTNGNWIGCDPESSADNPGGVQGAFYLYGDGASCDDTAIPCDASGCHLKGTSIDGDPGADWGCGLGLGLNTSATDTKQPYTAATCFDIEIAGTTGGLELRIAFTQVPVPDEAPVAPFRSIAPFTNGWSGEVCVTDVSCPNWSIEDELCKETGNVYDLQIQVAAGEMDTNYDLTVTKLIPKAEGGTTPTPGGNVGQAPSLAVAGSSCDNYHVKEVQANNVTYTLINNVWNPSGGQQCIEYLGTSFKITTQTNNSTSHAPASFPAAILGRKANHYAAGGGLPAQLSTISSLETGFKYKAKGIPGRYNAAYDIWLDSNPNLSGDNPQYFVMLWPWTQGQGVQPAGSHTHDATIEGMKWKVWTGGVGEHGGRYIAYQEVSTNQIESLHVDLKPFFDDATANHGLPANLHLINVQAGFEIWEGGQGLEAEYFYATVK